MAMRDRQSRNLWLRMTDQVGLTEPGKKAQLPSSGMLLFATTLWAATAVIWLSLAFQTNDGEGRVLYGVLVVLSLVLAVANFMMWRKSKKRLDESNRDSGH